MSTIPGHLSKPDGDAQRVLAHMREVGEPQTLDELVAAAETNTSSVVRKLLAEMKVQGWVGPGPRRGRSKTFVALSVPESAPENVPEEVSQETPSDVASTNGDAPSGDENTAERRGTHPNVARARDERVREAIVAAGETGASAAELADSLGVDRSLVYLSIVRLRDSGVIDIRRDGTRSPRYHASNG